MAHLLAEHGSCDLSHFQQLQQRPGGCDSLLLVAGVTSGFAAILECSKLQEIAVPLSQESKGILSQGTWLLCVCVGGGVVELCD